MIQNLLIVICAITLIFNSNLHAGGQDFLLLSSRMDERGHFSKIEIQGKTALIDEALPPASTFKTVIAWAGLESGVLSPETEILCRDPYIAGVPRKLHLQEAMKLSSNDFFIEVARRIGQEKLIGYVNQSGFLQSPVPAKWLMNDLKASAHAGSEKVTARHLHHWMEQLASKGLSNEEKINQALLQSMTWLVNQETPYKIYGKTGTHFGVARFITIIENAKGQKYVVTSLVPYRRGVDDAKAARNKAVGLVENFAKNLNL